MTNAWTDITWLLYNEHVSWAYYVQTGDRPTATTTQPWHAPRGAELPHPGHLEPAPDLRGRPKDHQIRNIQPLNNYFAEAKKGTLPSVMWVTPSQADSEHPPASVHQGQAYVTAVINAAMKSPDWTRPPSSCSGTTGAASTTTSCRHRPERLRLAGPGDGDLALRQVRLHRSPDPLERCLPEIHQDDFLGGSRLNPKTDKRPDPRPDVSRGRENTGEHGQRFRLQPGATGPGPPPDHPATDSQSVPTYFSDSGRALDAQRRHRARRRLWHWADDGPQRPRQVR